MPKNGKSNARSLVHPLDGVKESVPSVGHANSEVVLKEFSLPKGACLYAPVESETGCNISGLAEYIETLIVWEDLEDIHETEEKTLVEWFIENHTNYGCSLALVSDKSEPGNQFCKGFGGVGGILRYPVVLDNEVSSEDDDTFI